MICAQAVDGFLQVVSLASGESCQYLQLVEYSDAASGQSFLSMDGVLSLVAAAAGCYGLVFVVNTILYQLGFKRG